MKKSILLQTLIFFALTFLTHSVYSQAPQAIPYQAVARDNQGTPVTNQLISLQFSVRTTAPTGTIVYQEIHNVFTNVFGLFSINLGQGAPLIGTMSAIDWKNGAKFLQVELDALGGTSYTDMGTTQLMSVPYALYAESSASDKWLQNGSDISNMNTGNIGIGTNTPSEKLEVIGKTKTTALQITSNAGINKVLVSDANGNATWNNANTIAGGTLDQAYDFGGQGLGRTIVADSGALRISGEDGLFVTGTYGIGDTVDISGGGTRMFFNPRKAAFRAGRVLGSNWDNGNIGIYSTAIGYNTQASGAYSASIGTAATANGASSISIGTGTNANGEFSLAMGEDTYANGDNSTAMGYNTYAIGYGSTATGAYSIANGYASTALGYGAYANASGSTATGVNSIANGYGSTALGYYSNAGGGGSTAMGWETTTTGGSSTAMGYETFAAGYTSTAMGRGTKANGDYSTAMGRVTTANGDYSTAMGDSTIANGFASLVIGRYNDSLLSPEISATSTTPLFIIGNGNSNTARSNAMVVQNDGKVGIGTNIPKSKVDIEGGLAVGASYAGTIAAPTNGAVIEGKVGIGTNHPDSKLDVAGGVCISSLWAGNIAAPSNGVIIEGKVGIGTSAPLSKLDVEGGVSIGATYAGTTAAPINGAIIEGKVGIGTNSPSSSLHIEGGTDVSLTSVGYLILGDEAGTNIAMDNNEIMCRSNGAASDIYIQQDGGKVAIGSTGVPTHLLHVDGVARSTSISWAISSDQRVKKNVNSLPNTSLQKIMQLRPVTYEWIDNYAKAFKGLKQKNTGFISQELEQVFPEMIEKVEEKFGDETISDFRLLNLSDLPIHIVKAMQEQQAQIETQIQQIENLHNELIELKKLIMK
jgi:hypothetical protein